MAISLLLFSKKDRRRQKTDFVKRGHIKTENGNAGCGIYFIQMKNKNQSITQKIIVN